MAIYEQLKQYIEVLGTLEKTYGPHPKDKDTGKTLTWVEVLKRQKYGPEWEQNPLFKKEEEIIGAIPEHYFTIAYEILKEKPQWVETLR